MKVVLLHGPAIEASRKKLLEIKQKFNYEETVIFDSTNSPGEVLTNLQSESLFGGERLIIWENPSDDFTCTLYPVPCTLILWFDHEIDPKNWKGAEVLFFPEAKEISVFPFLDYLGNKDIKAFLEMDKLKKSSLPAGRQGFDLQYLITMILYLLRNLSCTPKNAKDFVKRKNEKMRANFSSDKLINLYKSVLDSDFKIKSGLMETEQAEFSLVQRFVDN